MSECTTSSKKYQKKRIGINEIYTFFMIASPILFIYGIGLGTLTLADSILMILNFIFILKILLNGKISVYFNLLPFLAYIIVLSLIIKLDLDALMRTLRYTFYLINIIFFTKIHYNFTFGVKVYRIISLVSTGFLFTQILLHNVFGVYLPGIITSANLVATDLYDYNSVLQQAQYKRFMSFFEEPSHFAIYILGYVTILLFTKMRSRYFKKEDIFELIFLSIGIAMSTSILGVMVLGAILGIWLLLYLFNSKKSFVKFILLALVFLIAIIIVSKTSAFEYFTNSNVVNRQAGGRFGGYSILKDWDKNLLLNIFGRGMIKNSYGTFLASYPLLIYYFGYVGFLLFITAFISYFKDLKMSVSKALIICLFGIALGSELLLGRFILVFLPLIITGATNVRIKKISKKFPIGDEPILK